MFPPFDKGDEGGLDGLSQLVKMYDYFYFDFSLNC